MAKYLFEARYTTEGTKGVVRDGGSARRKAVSKMAESLGGHLESFHFAFGDIDAFVIVDLPDDVSAAAVAMAVNQSASAVVRTIKLLTPEDMDRATKKTVTYEPPGRLSLVP